ncbi:MAG TPA: DinB family protein [Actinomycetota bacterium]|nr:DinB family protein [Actinomycetota bacterium]
MLLPDDALTDPDPDSGERWDRGQVLAHVAEMLPFWLGELERVVDGDGESAVPFGRIADDASRIGLIARDRSLPLRVLFARIDAGLSAWLDRLPRLTDSDRAKVGLHPRLGEMPVAGIADRFVIGHAEEHVVQLGSILAAAGR